jgi:hypothetical protein
MSTRILIALLLTAVGAASVAAQPVGEIDLGLSFETATPPPVPGFAVRMHVTNAGPANALGAKLVFGPPDSRFVSRGCTATPGSACGTLQRTSTAWEATVDAAAGGEVIFEIEYRFRDWSNAYAACAQGSCPPVSVRLVAHVEAPPATAIDFNPSNDAAEEFHDAPYTPSARIRLGSPNGGETWTPGSQQVVTWGHSISSTGCPGDYISLSLTDGFDSVSLGRAATTVSYLEVVVPFFPSTHLKVRVAYVVPCGEPVERFDASDATFTIDAPTPTVAMQTPSAGLPWPVGSWQLVSWTGPELPFGSCEYRSSALYAAWGTARETIATPAFGQRSFLWKVPNRPGESVRFGVAINARCGSIDYALSDWTDPVPIGVAAVRPPELPDFDADGNPDILWHHQENGELYAWLMEGTVAARGTFLDPRAFTDTQWQMRALADFDADGDADVLWHHQGTGELYVWFLDGAVTTDGAYLDPPRFADTQWQIRGVADFDGDGQPDVLWHHQKTGELYVWLMNGLTVGSGTFLTPSAVGDPLWQIRAVTDLNGDGRADLLWHHQGTGELYVWSMQGAETAWESYLDPRSLSDTRWQIRRVADFDRDGQPDILWHHQTTGELYVWLLDGLTVRDGTFLTPAAFADTRWQIMPR